MRKFSNEFKESLVEKVIGESRRSMRSVANEAQVAISSLHKWVHEAMAKTNSNPISLSIQANENAINWSSAKKLQVVIETAALEKMR